MSNPIVVSNPVTAPATSAVTYNLLWMSFLQVQAGDPNKPVRVMAQVNKMVQNTDGTYTLAPNIPGQQTQGTLTIPNVFATAATDTVSVTLPTTLGGTGPSVTLGLADIMDALLLKINQMATAAKVI